MKFHKSASDKIISGVCGGIAETLGLPSAYVRIFFVVFGMWLLPFTIILYSILSSVLPVGGQAAGPRNPNMGQGFGGGHPYGQARPGQSPFGGQPRPGQSPFGGQSQSPVRPYAPKQSPFDTAGAKDAEVNEKFSAKDYSEDAFYKESRSNKDKDWDK